MDGHGISTCRICGGDTPTDGPQQDVVCGACSTKGTAEEKTWTDGDGIERHLVEKEMPECCPGCVFKDPETDEVPCCQYPFRLYTDKNGCCLRRRTK